MSLCFCGVVKTTLRLQTNYNVLLVCLAGTDLLVGIVVQPSFIVAQVCYNGQISKTETFFP